MTETTSRTTLAVAEWVAGLRHDSVPDATRRVIRSHLLDTLGCGLYGRATEWTGIVERWARGQGEAPRERARLASVWGDEGPSLRPMDAALVNGIAAHAFELDDYHTVKIHPGAVVIPAALATAERLDASGTELATAIATGFEVMARTAAALEPSSARLRGWHLTGVTGTLGAAAAAASLIGLDAEHTAWALGIAGTQSSGLFAFNADGAMTKRFHAGRAAQAGLMAAELAQVGYTGPTQVFEAEDGGMLKAFSDASN